MPAGQSSQCSTLREGHSCVPVCLDFVDGTHFGKKLETDMPNVRVRPLQLSIYLTHFCTVVVALHLAIGASHASGQIERNLHTQASSGIMAFCSSLRDDERYYNTVMCSK